MRERILTVDDEEHMLALFESVLGKSGYTVRCASSGEHALTLLEKEEFDLVISDLLMPGIDGLTLLHRVKEAHPALPFIILTGHGTVRSAVDAMKEGATDYLTKPIDTDELQVVVGKALELRRLNRELEQLRARVANGNSFPHIIGRSPLMQTLLQRVMLVAGSEITVLLQGESGVGKELIAHAIHEQSARRAGPFVTIDCGTVPESLLESELFGYVKGAFTGAQGSKKGLFEEAHGGTLFLDEIGDTTPTFQAKLLRVLQTGETRPVGSTKRVTVDVRVIAATNKDLKQLVAERQFREDLYYRLAVVPLVVPPLRERREDIPLLVKHFLTHMCERHKQPPKTLSAAAMRLLLNAPWPGNVRELEHTIERTVVMTPGVEIQPGNLILDSSSPLTTTTPTPADVSRARAVLEMVEREKFRRALAQAAGNRSRAARQLGISRSTFYEKLKHHHLLAK
jgi:DNA-binding NtrC family response regulator